MSEPRCRFCAGRLDISLVDLGTTPLANNYLPDTPEAIAAETAFPLHVKVCGSCYLAQVTENVDPTAIFRHDYAYLSSYSAAWVAHAGIYAKQIIARFDLGPRSLVVEVASNDGYLLRHFDAAGIAVLGVEPAGHAAEVARSAGIDTRIEFFNEQTARALLAEGYGADLMAANNVFAHVPDIKDFANGFSVLLKPEGVVTFEFPHLLNLINLVQFDTIYHEHYSYLSLLAVERVLGSVGLRVFDVEELPTHGGSLRVFACHESASHTMAKTVAAMRARESQAGLGGPEGYKGFTGKVETVRENFVAFINQAKQQGRSVAAYGAAAKGNTFLNYCGIGKDQIDFVVDQSLEKQGNLLPGSHIPILAPEALIDRQPDFVVILPWNLRDEITRSYRHITDWDGRFVVAVPELKVLEDVGA